MIERGEHLRFTAEAGDAVTVDGEASGRIFNATSRLSLLSCARETSPIRLHRSARRFRTGRCACQEPGPLMRWLDYRGRRSFSGGT